MKKLISLILVLCMACALAPAMAEGVTGTWYLIEMNADGVSVSPADMGMTWTLVFNEDGTVKLVNDDDPCPCGSGKPYGRCCGNRS